MYIIPEKPVKMQPYAGSNIDKCKEFAIKFAKENKCTVKFQHNSSKFIAGEDGCIKTN